MPGGPLTVFGATGYTGRICAAVAAHGHLPLRLAGRDGTRLETLAADLSRVTGVTPDVCVADASRHDHLARLAAESGVIVSTVGPYARLGRAVVDAALAGGAHLIDVSGELGYLQAVHARDDDARAAGVTLCPGAGFDGGPAELLAGMAAAELPAAAGVAEVRAATMTHAVRPSRGTVRSALGVAAGAGAAVVSGRLVREPVAARSWRVPFPAPIGARGAVSIPGPEVLAVPRSLGATTVRAYGTAPAAWAWSAAAQPLGWLGRAAAATPLWSLLGAAADRLPEGPSPAQRAASHAAVLVEVRGGGTVRRAWARTPDPYDVTARVVVALARRLLAGGVGPGVRTALQVAGPAGARAVLEATGARVEVLATDA